MTVSFLPENAFPLPTPITPKLVALGLDDKIAATVSKLYLSVAHNLKETCETEYTRACNAFIVTSDGRGHSSKHLRSKLLDVTTARYTQALSKWMEEAVQKAEASLLGRKKKAPFQVIVGSRPQITPRTPTQVKNTIRSDPSPKGSLKLSPKQESVPVTVSISTPHSRDICLTRHSFRNPAHSILSARHTHSLTSILRRLDQGP